MKLSEHKDLKKEILALPAREKDKLLLRLVAKDKVLTEHLHYVLMEGEADLGDRILAVEAEIDRASEILAANNSANAKATLTSLRSMAKLVSHFYKITKSARGEVELRLYFLAQVPLDAKFSLSSAMWDFNDKLAAYYVKTTQSTLQKFYKLHEDIQFDLTEGMNGALLKSYKYFRVAAKTLQLPPQI